MKLKSCVLVFCCALLLAGCGAAPDPTTAPTPEVTPKLTATPQPTPEVTPDPTPTPAPQDVTLGDIAFTAQHDMTVEQVDDTVTVTYFGTTANLDFARVIIRQGVATEHSNATVMGNAPFKKNFYDKYKEEFPDSVIDSEDATKIGGIDALRITMHGQVEDYVHDLNMAAYTFVHEGHVYEILTQCKRGSTEMSKLVDDIRGSIELTAAAE